ncbi:MAG: GNAT family N-acetyltransferase [Cytophagales bacterium]|nr:GNAT family N-acetyltransferase [Cytophagales bacterium]
MQQVGGHALFAPTLLTAFHVLEAFNCDEASLDDWLKRRALTNHLNGASRTYVIADVDNRVFGYYALAAGAVSHKDTSSAVRRNMPDPIPVLVLGRLAIDRSCQGQQLGAALLKDAVQRTYAVAQQAGIRALLVHALNDRAKAFYEGYGFQVTPSNPLTLMLRIVL